MVVVVIDVHGGVCMDVIGNEMEGYWYQRLVTNSSESYNKLKIENEKIKSYYVD